MAAVSMEKRLADTKEPLANATKASSSDKGKLLPNSSKTTSSSSSQKANSKGKEAKRGKLSKALTLPADASSPPISNELHSSRPRPVQILPRTSQYEKHPLLQERSASGLSEIEAFLLENQPTKAKSQTSTQITQERSPIKLKLQPRGAQYERHALLVKTSSGKSELEQLLLEKEKEIEKKEKKLHKGSDDLKSKLVIPPLKRLFVKKGVTVEKAKSFEKTSCLEKVKAIDLASQNVSRARSLEEESSLEKVKPTKQQQCSVDKSSNKASTTDNSIHTADQNANPGCSSSRLATSKKTDNMTNLNNANPEQTGANVNDNSACSKATADLAMKKQRLLDLALKPNLEWREDDQQFVVVLQSPVSPLEEKPENLLICYERRANSVDEATYSNHHCCSSVEEAESAQELKKFPVSAFDRPTKKTFHPTVIDSDPDSEGMVCMDELEADLDLSSLVKPTLPHEKDEKRGGEDNKAEDDVEDDEDDQEDYEDMGQMAYEPEDLEHEVEIEIQKENIDKVPLLAELKPKTSATDGSQDDQTISASQRVLDEITQHVDVMTAVERRRKLSLKRASLGQLEPRVEQYVQHPLLEEKDEEGKSAIEKLLKEKLREQEVMEQEAFASAEKEAGDLAVGAETKHQSKASIKRVHFEKSDGGSEIEMLGKVEIEADPASTTSNKSNGSKKKGFRGSKNNKNKNDAPEEEKLLDGETDGESEKDAKKDEGKNRCCCIS